MAVDYNSIDAVRQALQDLPRSDEKATRAAHMRNETLTKPPGALGRFEELAIWFAGWRGDARPRINNAQVIVFAGNHGVASHGVSAFPPEVTAQMVANFQAGGAAINQICASVGAQLNVIALDLDHPTADFRHGPAMTEDAFLDAFSRGAAALEPQTDLLVVGEMGIGNTTAAAALSMALFGGAPSDWVGRGTGVDAQGIARKHEAVLAGLAANPIATSDPLAALRCLGGREMAAMAGAILAARHARVPVLLDGFICTSSAAALAGVNPEILDHCKAGHQSDEAAHGRLLSLLDKPALLTLGLRLGEASGGAAAIGLLKTALACHSGMASFEQAGVSSKSDPT